MNGTNTSTSTSILHSTTTSTLNSTSSSSLNSTSTSSSNSTSTITSTQPRLAGPPTAASSLSNVTVTLVWKPGLAGTRLLGKVMARL